MDLHPLGDGGGFDTEDLGYVLLISSGVDSFDGQDFGFEGNRWAAMDFLLGRCRFPGIKEPGEGICHLINLEEGRHLFLDATRNIGLHPHFSSYSGIINAILGHAVAKPHEDQQQKHSWKSHVFEDTMGTSLPKDPTLFDILITVNQRRPNGHRI